MMTSRVGSLVFFFQAEDGIRDHCVTGVQTCALPISQQDIDLGKRAAADAAKQLPLCNAPKVDAYLTQLGMRLAAKHSTGGVQYPFEFHCVNEKRSEEHTSELHSHSDLVCRLLLEKKK